MGVYDDLGILRAFVCIVESGSISAAARKLHVTQPTLSRQLQSLEAACGTSLLRRDTHRMHLTDAGHRFAEDARGLLSLAEESELRLHHNQSELRGNIRVFSTIPGTVYVDGGQVGEVGTKPLEVKGIKPGKTKVMVQTAGGAQPPSAPR